MPGLCIPAAFYCQIYCFLIKVFFHTLPSNNIFCYYNIFFRFFQLNFLMSFLSPRKAIRIQHNFVFRFFPSGRKKIKFTFWTPLNRRYKHSSTHVNPTRHTKLSNNSFQGSHDLSPVDYSTRSLSTFSVRTEKARNAYIITFRVHSDPERREHHYDSSGFSKRTQFLIFPSGRKYQIDVAIPIFRKHEKQKVQPYLKPSTPSRARPSFIVFRPDGKVWWKNALP